MKCNIAMSKVQTYISKIKNIGLKAKQTYH